MVHDHDLTSGAATDATTENDKMGSVLDPISNDFMEELQVALGDVSANEKTLQDLLAPLYPADIADVLEQLEHDARVLLLDVMGDNLPPDTLMELNDSIRDEVITHMGLERLTNAVQELDSDDTINLIADLTEAERAPLLESLSTNERATIVEGIGYEEETAGRLMQHELVRARMDWSVGDTIDFIRQSADTDTDALPEMFYDIFVVDKDNHPLGMVPLSTLLRARREVPIQDIMRTDMSLIRVNEDQEDIAHLFRRRDLVSAPVIDDNQCLIGVITVDDIVDVIDREYHEDIMLLGGVGDSSVFDAMLETTRTRFSWLAVNLLTAVLASVVIGLFQATLEQAVALAILMPIVASMGGNAATQTLTVTVRSITTRDLTEATVSRFMNRELLVGFLNGILFALLSAGVAFLWFQNATLALVLALAMIINMVVAALAGVMVPMFLYRRGIDPAVASGVFVTTVTDVIGFFSFLGLAVVILF